MTIALGHCRPGILLVSASIIAVPQIAHSQSVASAYTSGYRYDPQQRLVGTIAPDPDGAGPIHYAAVRNTYDAEGRLTKVEKGELLNWQSEAVAPSAWTGFSLFQTVDYSYDGDGRRTKETLTGSDSVVRTVSQASYDALDRPVCAAVRMDPAQWNSQSDACVPQTTGPNGADRISKTLYDLAGNVSKIQKAVGTNLQQDYATYTYTASNKPASVTDANQTRAEYAYDVQDRLYRWYFPSKTTANIANTTDYEEYSYDPNGNRRYRRNRRGYWFEYMFDSLNRNISKIVPDDASWLDTSRSRDSYFGYDNRGLMTYARFDSASGPGITNAFDNAGRQTSSTNTMLTNGKTLSYSYDADSNRARMAYPEASIRSDVTYDGLDRADLVYWTNTGGTWQVADYNYNSLGMRASRSVASSTGTYAYDPAGRLSGVTQWFPNSANNLAQNFGYNPASQITTATRDSDAFVYTGYYAVNRNYFVNGLNQYANVGSLPAFQYDGTGNLTNDGTNGYVYDMENRLVWASGPRPMALWYDPLGRLWRTETWDTHEVRGFLYDGDKLVAEYDDAGNLMKRYFFGPGVDEPLTEDDASFNCGAARILHADNQGSIIARADCSGNIVNRNTYDEWGIPGSGNAGRFQYTGQVWMPELGMYYYKARMYSPTLGRFMQTDPIGYKDQINLYEYVGDDPVDGRDPSGLCNSKPDKNTSADDVCKPVQQLGTSERGVRHIQSAEGGFKSKVYDDNGKARGGFLTVGYGHKLKAGDGLKEGQTIDQAKGGALFGQDLKPVEQALRGAAGTTPLSQREFDALVDLGFNAGKNVYDARNSPNLRDALDRGDYGAMSDQLKYTRGPAGTSEGLERRSEARREIFVSGDYPEN